MKKTCAFTICANNYLAQAEILANSFKIHHNDIDFLIFVADMKSPLINYGEFSANEIVFIKDVINDEFIIEQLSNKYNIVEFCTTVKPDCIEFLFSNYYETIMYLDPDIQVFSKFDELFNSLISYDVVLTPHLCSPTKENVAPSEFELMRTGIFNLGFIALNNTNETLALVSWWKDKLYKFGDNDLSRGLFYDQIWMMLAPCFLDNVKILRHLGYNVCNWNLHERYFERNANDYIINEKDKLRFFHFSHFKEINLPFLASYNPTYSIENRPDIADIYLEYLDKMNKSQIAYKDIKPYFGNGVKVKKTEKVLSKKENIKWILKHLKLLFS